MSVPSSVPTGSAAGRRSINIRVKRELRDLIDQAAAVSGKSRSDFMLEAARRAAEDALLDRTFLRVDRKTHARFLSLLDAAPRPNARLRRLMQTKAPWE